MEIDKDTIVTQEETGEEAPLETADRKADAEIQELEQEAKRVVKEGLELTQEDGD